MATKAGSSQFLALEQFPEGYSAPSSSCGSRRSGGCREDVPPVIWGATHSCIFGITLLCTL